MKRLSQPILSWLVLGIAMAADASAGDTIKPLAGTNLALGKKATYSWEPNYPESAGGDETDLTDGKFWQPGSEKRPWVVSGTVGWRFARKPGVLITLDLERIAAIDTVGFDTAAGAAEVTFPAAVLLYVSDDGQSWHYATDLINKTVSQRRFTRHRFVARDLKTRGRYVAMYIVKGGMYAFVDEIEVLEGRHQPSDVSFPQEGIDRTALEADATERGKLAIQKKATLYLIQAAREQLGAAGTPPSTDVLTQLRKLEQSAVSCSRLEEVDYSQGLPYTEIDRDVCRAVGEHFGKQATSPIAVWEPVGSLWSHDTNPFARPSRPQSPRLRADMMIGEYEPVAFNVSNESGSPVTVQLSVDELRDSTTGGAWPAAQIDLRATIHVLASGYRYFDDALSPVRDGRLVIPPGMTRQVWLILDSRGVRPQEYVGRVAVKAGTTAVEVPLAVTVYPVEMPTNPAYLSHSWSNFESPVAQGHEEQAAAELERCYENVQVVSYPSAPWPKVDKATKRLVRPLTVDFTKLDRLIALRPYVKQWLLWTGFDYGQMRQVNYHGANDMPEAGTPENDALFKEWVHQIRDHLLEKGISTDRWAFYWVDEPKDDAFVKCVVPASLLAKSVDPTILVWENAQVSLPVLKQYSKAADIHCYTTDHYQSHPEILRQLQAEKCPAVHYMCGSCKAEDPHQYYRLHHHRSLQLGLDGAGMWVWGDEGGQFSDYNGLFPSYAMVYGTPEGPMTGKRREAWREGVEDVELWRHLREAVAKSRSARLTRLLKTAEGDRVATPKALLHTRREILRALGAGNSMGSGTR